jgi:putative CocE/NonD family hydrolase
LKLTGVCLLEKNMRRLRLHATTISLLAVCFAASSSVSSVSADSTPLREPQPQDEFIVREEMVPMRDGVKLYTLLIRPKIVTEPLPVLLLRTPYNASNALHNHASTQFESVVGSHFISKDFIYVTQDIRGRYKSEGDFVMYRPPRGEFNNTDTDETTDAWDTIEWLIGNVKSNGRVGVWGTSYPGWLTLAALREPHPALAVAVPCNPVVDVWKADDWFHWGAFRVNYAFDYIYGIQTQMDKSTPYPYESKDIFAWALDKGSAAAGFGSRLDQRHQMWDRLMKSPSYGPYWRAVAADRWFDGRARQVPTLHVHGFWDQEDIYGAPAVYRQLEEYDTNNDLNYFAAGPWYHGQHFGEGSRLASLNFDQDTAKQFRDNVLAPFLLKHLHPEENRKSIAPVVVFETGTNCWREFNQWPPPLERRRLYLHPNRRLGFSAPDADRSATEFVSDPAKPVPYAPRPNWAINYRNTQAIAAWRRWLVEDQRFVDGRPDVLTWSSEPLTKPLTVRGPVIAKLFASTTGTDADWVAKLIDVYPDDAGDFQMSGYQLMISADIFRGRYRENYEQPKPLQANTPLEFTIPLPHVNHTFLPGHRLMVQIQSTWFPLYDRNPQTFVPSIMTASPEAYQSQRHRIHHERSFETHIELLVEPAT